MLSLTAMKKIVSYGSEHAHVLCNMLLYFLVLSKCSVFSRCDYDAACLLTHTQYPQSTSPAVRDCFRYPAVFLSVSCVKRCGVVEVRSACVCLVTQSWLVGVACCFVAVLY